MKKVTLLGDSIRLLGYGKAVPKLLGEEFFVYQPAENCRYAKYTLRGILTDWRKDMENSDVIHWNNGLWDAQELEDGSFTEPEEYVRTMLRIAALLKTRAKTVIFATTTPVAPQRMDQNNSRIEEYNRVLVPRLKAMGIRINDLHALMASDVPAYLCEDHIHLSEAGIAVCGEAVAEAIREAAREL